MSQREIISLLKHMMKKRICEFHYWTAGKHFYLSMELEDGTTVRKCRVSEKEYMDALETYHDMQK